MGVGQEFDAAALYRIAHQVAHRYAHLVWVDRDDAAQAAMVEMLGALRGLTEQPANLRSYLVRVAWLSVQHHVCTQLSPVKHTDRGQLPYQAAAIVREEADGPALEHYATDALAADAQLEAARWQRSVRRRVRELVADDCRQERQIVERQLRDDAPPREVAADTGVPVQLVYAVSERTKYRILRDAQMQRLMREMPSRSVEE